MKKANYCPSIVLQKRYYLNGNRWRGEDVNHVNRAQFKWLNIKEINLFCCKIPRLFAVPYFSVRSSRIEIEGFALRVAILDDYQIRCKPRRPPSRYIIPRRPPYRYYIGADPENSEKGWPGHLPTCHLDTCYLSGNSINFKRKRDGRDPLGSRLN